MITSTDPFAGVVPFLHVAELLSFRAAAERLGVSTAAVSKAVLKLEARLGVRLLVRSSRRVALTPEGTELLRRAKVAVDALGEAQLLLSQSRRQPKGELHVSLPATLARRITQALPTLLQRYPALSLRLSLSDRMVRLGEEGIDLAVRIAPLHDSPLVARHLRDTRWVLVAAPSYLARRGMPTRPDELADHDTLSFVPPSGRPRKWIFREPDSSRVVELSPSSRVRIDQGEHLLEAAGAGLGLVQGLDVFVEEALATGRLVEVLPGHSAPGPPVHAVALPERARTPNVRAFSGFLRETLGRA